MNMNWKHRQLNVNGKCNDKTCDYCHPKTKLPQGSDYHGNGRYHPTFNWWPKLPKLRGNK